MGRGLSAIKHFDDWARFACTFLQNYIKCSFPTTVIQHDSFQSFYLIHLSWDYINEFSCVKIASSN